MRGSSWRPDRPLAVLGVALGALCASACGDGIRNRITLMPWDRLRGSPGALTVGEAAQGMRDAGLNTAGFVKPKDLDTCRKHGLSALVDDPRVSGYDWQHVDPQEVAKFRTRTMSRTTKRKTR